MGKYLVNVSTLINPHYSLVRGLEICENLASAIAQFWWSSNPPTRGIHCAKWEKMCASIEERGIGFPMIHEYNLALLAKHLWRVVQFPNSLVARVLRGKYYRLSSPLRIGAVDNPSYVWTSIIAARKLLLLGIRNKVHSGYEINFWQDPWILSTPARLAGPRAPVVHPKMTISSLINFYKGVRHSITGTICRPRGHTDDSESGHKPYSST